MAHNILVVREVNNLIMFISNFIKDKNSIDKIRERLIISLSNMNKTSIKRNEKKGKSYNDEEGD